MKQTTLEDYEQRLARVERKIEENLDHPFSPLELAKTACFSLHHFHRIFRAQRGESVMQRIRRLRLERAARKIRYSTARLIEIAMEAGYESHEAFTRAFAEHFGVAPSTYRQKKQTLQMDAMLPYPRPTPAVLVRVESFPVLSVFSMRSHGSYAQVGATWQTLLAWIKEHTDSIPALYGLCPDDPDVTEEKHLRFDACVLSKGLPFDSRIEKKEIPAGQYAVGLHVGSYLRLHETYLDVIGRWFPQSGFEPAPEPVVEHYISDPAQTKEEDLLTEVRVRIAD